jgi:hypothetical protein
MKKAVLLKACETFGKLPSAAPPSEFLWMREGLNEAVVQTPLLSKTDYKALRLCVRCQKDTVALLNAMMAHK